MDNNINGIIDLLNKIKNYYKKYSKLISYIYNNF